MILYYLLIAVLPLDQHPLWGQYFGDLTLIKYVGLICGISAAIYLAYRSSSPQFFGTWPARWCLALFLLGALSLLRAGDPAHLLDSTFMIWLSMALLFFSTLSFVDSLGKLHTVILVTIGSVAFSSLYVIRGWQKYHAVYEGFRSGGMAGDPNYFSLSIMACLPVGFCLAAGKGRYSQKVLLTASVVVMFMAFVFAASRGGLLALAGAAFYMVARSKRPLVFSLIALVLLAPPCLLYKNSAFRRLIEPANSDQGAQEARTTVWRAGLQMIGENPLLGVGIGNFKARVIFYEGPDFDKVQSMAHNTYVELAAELGIPGLFAFLMILISSFVSLERVSKFGVSGAVPFVRHAAFGLQAALVGAAICAFFISAEYHKLLWLLFFLCICTAALAENAEARLMRRLAVKRAEKRSAVSRESAAEAAPIAL